MKRRGAVVAGTIGFVVILFVIFSLILPKISAVHKSKDQLAAAEAKQAQLEAQLTELQATEAQAEKIRTELHKLETAVPPTVDLPGLIRTLNDLADQSGVDFMTLAPGQPSAVQGGPGLLPGPSPLPGASPLPGTGGTLPGSLPLGVSILPVSITINGSYFAVDEYLFRLETFPRISKVTSITLTIGPGGYPQLSLTIQANFYTTDTSAGPGSQPGSQGAGGVPAVPPPTPSTSPTPSPTFSNPFSPSPSGSPSPTG